MFAVSDYNERYCDPPLPEAELDTIVRSICGRYGPGASVMPTLRDTRDDFNDLGTWVESPPKKAERLLAESAESLCSRYVEPPNYIVPGLITYGITILASPPKFGKSWMCLDMALSVATGTSFMGLGTNKDRSLWKIIDYRTINKHRGIAREFVPRTLDFNVHPHLLRHTCITQWFEKGLDIKQIQYLAGHASTDITLEIYTHYQEKERRKQTAEMIRA